MYDKSIMNFTFIKQFSRQWQVIYVNIEKNSILAQNMCLSLNYSQKIGDPENK